MHSKDLKDRCLNMDEFPKNTEVSREPTDSEDDVKHIHVSCAFKNETDCNFVVNPCYVKLERVNIPVKRYHEDLSENSSMSKKIKSQEYNKCLNHQDERTSNSDCLFNRKQPNDTAPNHRSSESIETFSEKILKPCYIRLLRCFDNEFVSDVDHATSTSNDYQMNILNEEEENNSDSFISADQMTSASSSVGTETYRIESEETVDSDDHILNFYTKDRAKLFSSSSSLKLIIEEDGKSDDLISECKTIKNPENDCLKKRENIFSKKKAKIRKIVPSKKRDFNFETLVNSSSDSSRSTLFDSSILENNSSKLIGHSLKGKNIKCDFSPVSFSGLTASINAVKTIKPVLCEQNRNSLDITNMNNNNSFTNKYEPSCKSDTVQNLSDNFYTKYNSNTEGLKDNCFKYCSSTKRKHFMINSTNFCKGESEKNFIPSEEMSSSSSLLGSKLRNSESEKQVNELSNYTVKPCYVTLTRMKDIDALAKRIGEKSNLVKENIHKHNSLLEFELNCNKQIKSVMKVNISKKNKAKIGTEESKKCIGENAVSVDDCKVFTDSVNDCTSRRNDSITNSVDLLECPKEPIHTTSSKSYKKRVPSSSDDSVSLPDIIEIVNNSKHLYGSARKLNFQNDDTIENDKRIVNEHEICIINESVDESHASRENNEGNKSSSHGNGDRLSDRVRTTDKITCTFKRLSKSSARKLSSESDDTVKNGKRIVNDHETCVINVSDYKSHAARDINNESNKNSSHGNSDSLSHRVSLSDRVRRRDNITCTSKQLNKSSARKLSSESDGTIENGKRIVNDHETCVINVNDYKSYVARDINNEGNKSSSHGNSDRLSDRVRTTDKITFTFKHLNKSSARKLSSESDDPVENGKRIVNDSGIFVANESDDESNLARDINNEVIESCSHENSDRLSDRVRTTDKITSTSKHLNKSSARKLSSESDDTVENGKIIVNDRGIFVANESDDESNDAREINNDCNRSYSPGSSESNRLPDRFRSSDKIPYTSKHLNKSSTRNLSSESDDTMENGKRVVNQYVSNITSESDDASGINIAHNRRNSPGNSEINIFSNSVISNDSDTDKAYFADTDDCIESDIVNLETCSVHDISEENSTGLNVNPRGTENEDKSASTRKIPYCSRFKNKFNDSIYVFRSKANGSVYIVDLFQYGNIRKMFVTIHMKEKGNLSIKERFIKNDLRNVTDKMDELGCYDKQNEKMFRGVPGFLRYINPHKSKKETLEQEVPCLSFTSTYSNNTSNDVPSDSLNCAESSDSVCSQPGPGCSQNSPSKNTTVHNDSSDDSDDQCVHCSKKFANRKENYNHTCIGKLEKGFLCMYCEKIFPSYLKLVLHKRMHFM